MESSVEQQHQVSKILGPPENRETTGKTSNAELMENDLESLLQLILISKFQMMYCVICLYEITILME